MNASAVLKPDRVEAIALVWNNMAAVSLLMLDGIGGEGGRAELTMADAPLGVNGR